MAGYNHFHNLAQVVSWARFLVDNGHKEESDFTMQRMKNERKSGGWSNGWAFEQGVRLALELPDEYTTWCTLQRVTGKRGVE